MSQTCRSLFLVVLALAWLPACSQINASKPQKMNNKAPFDWQGHRGSRGLAPENTIPAFLKALEFPQVRTLELDLAVSADGQLVVSHEPWMSAAICTAPNGQAVTSEQAETFLIYRMTYDQVRQFDCGARGNARFPDQKAQATFKPTLDAVVTAVENQCGKMGREMPHFNIEIKSQPEWDGLRTPPVEEFVKLVLQQVKLLNLVERVCIQSFDKRVLQIIRKIDPSITMALLVENPFGMENNLADLGFTPAVYSPYYRLVTANMVREAHRQGMKVIPWTVNETTEMEALIRLGVDGIITDYPNRIPGGGK